MPGTQQMCSSIAVLPCAPFPLGRLLLQGPFPGPPEPTVPPGGSNPRPTRGARAGRSPGPRGARVGELGGRRSVTLGRGPERGAPCSQPISSRRRTMGPRRAEPGPPWVRFPAPHIPRRRLAPRATPPGPVGRSDTPAPLGGARATPGSGTQPAPVALCLGLRPRVFRGCRGRGERADGGGV